MSSMNVYGNPGFSGRERQDSPSRKLASMSVPAVERVLYECPVGRFAEIVHLRLASSHSGSEAISLWHVRAGESTAVGNALFYEYSLSAKAVVSEDAPIYVNQGERLIVKAGAADRITVTLYGREA